MHDETPIRKDPRWRVLLDVAVSLAVLLAAAVVVWSFLTRPNAVAGPSQTSRRGEPLPDSATITLEDTQTKGSPQARIALVEYSEFQCPFCASFFRDTWPVLQNTYINAGKVLFAFKHLPLPMHQFAAPAAEASECAGRQNQFWAVHDWLFADPSRITQLRDTAIGELGLVRAAFEACLASDQPANIIRRHRSEARELGITATPTFLLGKIQADGRVRVVGRIPGAAHASVFSEMIDGLLRKGS